MTTTRVGLVGLGIIAKTHLAVLADLASVRLAFTVDPHVDPPAFGGATPTHHASLTDALDAHEVDLLVLATPTPTHAALAGEALITSSARILVEKPLVHDLTALDRLHALGDTIDLDRRVAVAHHFAFAPEVRWAADLIASHADWGPITTITAAFFDPYIRLGRHAFDSYVSSWMDSGINQLSMLTRFVELTALTRRQEADGGAAAWATATYRHRGTTGTARLRTSWLAGDSSKRTTLTFAGAGIEIWIDHTAMTGFAIQGDKLLASHGDDGRTPRKIAHYRPLYETILAGATDPAITFTTATTITRLLHTRPGPG